VYFSLNKGMLGPELNDGLHLDVIMALIVTLLAFLVSGCFKFLPPDGGSQAVFSGSRSYNAEDVAVAQGYRIEIMATGLTFPTGVTFDREGIPYVVESGYSYGEVWDKPRLLRIGEQGRVTQIAEGENNGPWTGVSYYNDAFYVAEGGTLRGGRILKILFGGAITPLVSDLPSMGDHQTNGPVIAQDGILYFSIGTFSNSGIVGEDNYRFGWLVRNPHAHDIPCQDVTLRGVNFSSQNPFTPQSDDRAMTGAYVEFGTSTRRGEVIPGHVPCSGSVMRMDLGSAAAPELVAWGFRNPFGLALAPNGRLYATDNSYDDRGSRPVHGTGDLLWLVEPQTWYGWPDYHGLLPLDHRDHFIPPGKPQPPLLLESPPNIPPAPVAVLGVHSSSNSFDFSRHPQFGYVGEAFIAQFGDQSPTSGKVMSPVGFKVVRVNVHNGAVEDFAVNRGRVNGPASKIGGGGLERPVAARFSPDGSALYIVDFGVMTVGQGGKVRQPWATKEVTSEPRRGTGALWKITKSDGAR
jgi:glucose/arabinose dehydrogenase